KILDAKRAKGLTWAAIAKRIGGASPIVITAALLGQMKLLPAQAKKAGALLGLKGDEVKMLSEVPYRGSLPPGPPTDPLIYRLYELVQVYGTTLKELIQEEFGDGIMSHRFRHDDGTAPRSEGRSGQDHDVGQVLALQSVLKDLHGLELTDHLDDLLA